MLNRLRLPCETFSRRRETDLSSPLKKHEVNLANITVLIADQNDGGRRILYELLHAIGSRDLHSVANFKLAQQFLKTEPIDLFICDMNLAAGDKNGATLIKQLRSMDNHVNAEIPVLLTCSHTRQKETLEARDCGANMLLAKPYSVSALYDRLAWMAHRPRPFVKCDVYRGPDRRFKDEEFDSEERRSTSASEQTKKKAVA